MNALLRHLKFRTNAVETQIHIGFGKRKWMINGHSPVVFDPLVHAPEVGIVELQFKRVYNSRDKRQLLRRPNRSTNTDWTIGRRLLPNADILESFRAIKLFDRVVDRNFKSGPS